MGDLAEHWIVVGGLVPSLLIDQERLGAPERHVGTLDLDVGLELAVLENAEYRRISARLREAGFRAVVTDRGHKRRQRWVHGAASEATIDFLIPPVRQGQAGGTLQDLEPDFAAFVMPGLDLAFRDRRRVQLAGKTLLGEDAKRELYVCGPGIYVVLKALAFGGRGATKDAYDIGYVLQHVDLDEVSAAIVANVEHDNVVQALEVLRRDFTHIDAIGPKRAAEFLARSDDEFRADFVALVADLLRRQRRSAGR